MSYRNIHYNNHKKEITLWTWDENGNRIMTKRNFKPYLYIEKLGATDGISIYNTPLQKIEFGNQADRNNFVKNVGMHRLFHNIEAEHQFLLDEYNGLNETPEFSKNPLKIYFLDIETYSPNEFPNPDIANDTINVITIYDSLSDKFHTWGLRNSYTPNRPNSRYYRCSSESELLEKFLDFWDSDYPDVLSGWNSTWFDIPYLINRITNVLGEQQALRLSPVGNLFKKENTKRNIGGQTGTKWYIKGLTCLDYLDVYLTFSREKRPSYALNYIAEIELNDSKDKINATSLTQLADEKWDEFINYNIKDVELLVRLEEKLQFIKICRMLAYMGLTSIERALGTIHIVTGAIALEAKKIGKILPTFNVQKNKSSYVGGWVMPPKKGLQEAITSFDANSLYPNTIITLNISPETKIGKVTHVDNIKDEIVVTLVNGKEYTLSKEKFLAFMNSEKLALSKESVLFTQKEKGLCPLFVDKIYTDRVKNKNSLKSHKKQILKCQKDTPEYEEHRREIERLDIMQYTLKILMNRLYGTFANTYSPLYDVDLAASITKTGQGVIKETGNISTKYAKEKYNIDSELLIYQDTDSIYMTIKPILDKQGILLSDTKRSYPIIEDFEKYINSEIKKWAAKSLNSLDCRFEFKRETICDAGLFIEKKRYILHILDEEGIPTDKVKFVGVQYASTATPKKVKVLIKEIVDEIFRTKRKGAVDDIYFKSYEKFKQLDADDLCKYQGIKNIEKYEVGSTGFKTAKRTPYHVKSAIYYNRLLDELKIADKYEKIKSGSKIRLYNVKPNKYGIQSIAYNDKLPEEFGLEIDKELMFNKLVFEEVGRFYTALEWNITHPNNQTNSNLLELFG